MHPLFLVTLLLVARPQPPASPAAPKAPLGGDDLASEVQRAVNAYNARDLSYYESVLDPKSVYIAEDGAVISGRERVLRTFGRIFAADPPRRIEISDLSVDRRGDTGWAMFRWTLTAGSDMRLGVATVLFVRDSGGWRPMIIQNTLRAHAMRPAASPAATGAASPAPSPSPR
jgi:ketosteroid isomerase-like protein